MKLFCAYAFTGEDVAVISKRMRLVVDTLASIGHDAYCNLFDENVSKLQLSNNIPAIFNEAFRTIKHSDAIIAIIASPKISIGQTMEIGVALSQNKPLYLFEHTSATGQTYLTELAVAHFTWDTPEDLAQALQNIA